MNPPLVVPYDGHHPQLDPTAFVAPGSTVLGRVRLAAGASVWYGSVLRGDNDALDLGAGVNVQDGCILHTDAGRPLTIGAESSLGHGAVVHGCQVADHALIGMRAVVLNGCSVGRYALVAAGAVLRPGFVVPEGTLVAGVPAKVVRDVTDEERAMIDRTAASYRGKAQLHRAALAGHTTSHTVRLGGDR
jgi:carbonic anhydrase/acetyltransferase-like protein (isoleucine patch superfamily)